MPVIDLLLSEDGSLSRFASMVLTATTIYPDKEDKRQQLLIATAAKALVMSGQAASKPKVEIATDWLDLLLNSPAADKILSDGASYAANSWIAGEMIQFMLNAAIHHPELDVTLTKAVWALPRLLGGVETWGGGTVSVGQRTVWKAWSRFKSVAHFHAVRQIWLNARSHQTDPDIEGFVSLQNNNILEFLAISEAIRKAAVERRILRHEDTWRPPESLVLPPANLKIPPLPPPALRELGKYRPEYAKDAEPEED